MDRADLSNDYYAWIQGRAAATHEGTDWHVRNAVHQLRAKQLEGYLIIYGYHLSIEYLVAKDSLLRNI